MDIQGILKELPNDGRVPKTKIICTLRHSAHAGETFESGDERWEVQLSHGTHEYHQETLNNLRIAMHNTKKLCAVMLDTKGPEIQTGFQKDGKPIQLREGQEITVSTDCTLKGDEQTICMSYKKLATDLKPGKTILCADGKHHPHGLVLRCRCQM